MRRMLAGFGLLYLLAWGLALPARPGPVLALAAAIAPPLVWASAVDARRFLIPDGSVLATGAIALAFRLATGAPVWPALAAAAVAGGGFWALGEAYFRLRGREGLGMGDAKLLAALALVAGPGGLWLTVLLAALGGILAALVARARTRPARRGPAALEPVPFGPFLAYAGFVTLLLVGEV